MQRLENIDLNLLLLLHWLLEEHNVTLAAKRLGISQPAASRGLQRLRKEFSDELLVRSGRGYVLSRLANSIREDLAKAFQHLRVVTHMEDVFTPVNFNESVVIACNDYLSSICTEAWIDSVAPYAPNIRSSWRPIDNTVIDGLVSGQIDFAILPKAAQANVSKTTLTQDMVVKPLLQDKFVLFGGPSNVTLQADKVSLEAIANADHILVSPHGEGLGFVDEALAKQNLKRRIVHRTASFNHAAQLAVRTGNLTVLPKRLALLTPNNIFRSLPFKAEVLHCDIIWHVSRTGDKAHAWVRHQLQAFFDS